MIRGNVSQMQFLEKTFEAKTNNSSKLKCNTTNLEKDDFKKVLNRKKEEQNPNSSKVESRNKMEDEENKVSNIKKVQDNYEENKNTNVEEEKELNELYLLIEDLMQVLQSSNVIDSEKLGALTKQIEDIISDMNINGANMSFSSDLDLDMLKKLLGDLKLIKGSDIINNEELKEIAKDTIDKLSQILETSNSYNVNNSEKLDLEHSSIKNETNITKDESNITKDESNIATGKEATEQRNPQISIIEDENSKGQFAISVKKNVNINTELSSDTDITPIKNFQLDNTNNIQNLNGNTTMTGSTNRLDLNIFNQILEGAKVSISEDVSEMLLKLKPDNLGKMSMKIAVERGILVARFEVESQIVKEAIESNLEDLRNALSDKGFEIKEFNVSVNKDSDHQENSFSYFSKKKSKKIFLNNNQLKNDTYALSQQTIDGLSSSIDYLA
ncbi:flagellar hook-length control protein FliK [Paramaledivibacter caminithermalis]|jgi:flagellar hook-length control protein FliK|uniref:Hook-length control protein FliK n=1 Tax=Paramaledivibacter caminithermalis (strain DSM 15212 / CIP 107654 / DViRD3) TaxID=1121301 RepID=A0A1M6N7V0_PARC5|nr:flagellar hook-length control protein FliK [Paramaledivibacter caminithermalis]SHJ91714.1 hook-length control protein FliK [Paramaledivibacter caminithermalis DSM 15212]